MRYCEQCGASFRFSRTCPKDGTKPEAGGSDPLIGRVLGERYRVLDRIGAGGMGQVYRAVHTRIACLFAIKVVWGDLAYDPEMQLRFFREAETSSCLQSRYIVRVTDFGGDAASLPYLVMEYLDGPCLGDVISRDGALPPERAVRIASHIARGLAHAHARGVVHRDLKPDNVLIVKDDDEPDVVKLLDFGIATVQGGERLTAGGVLVGTPLYMSPEQFSGGAIDGRSDLYALGVVLHEMLSGQPPFDAPSLPELTLQHMKAEPPSLRDTLASRGGPPGLDLVVRRLLAKRPEDRYGSAREVVDALAESLAPPPRASMVPVAPTLPPLVDPNIKYAIDRAILAGAPLYNAGDHAGCYRLYRALAEDVARRFADPIAIPTRLAAALGRAVMRTNPTDAAWDLRYAFDDILGASSASRALGSPIQMELAAFKAISSAREAEGRLDIVGDYLVAFARGLGARLANDPATAGIAQSLERAAREGDRVGGGNAAIHAIDPVLRTVGSSGHTLVSGQAPTPEGRPSSGVPFSIRNSAAPVSANLRSEVCDRIHRAIRLGAPAYNDGRHDVCARLYREAATELATMAAADPSGAPLAVIMNRALAESQIPGRTSSEAAWVLRYAFDAVLAGG